MPANSLSRAELVTACDLALGGKWEEAHAIAQKGEGERMADWIHAVLHKIEGDEDNSRYWYRRSEQDFTAYADPADELRAIKAMLTY